MPQYKRPPITEAVIEIRFADVLPKELIEKLHTRFRTDYGFSETINQLGVQVNMMERQAVFDERFTGYKLSSNDRADALLFTPSNVIMSRLAPYEGWDKFRARASDTWKDWKRLAGYRKLQRIGVRYINRIDIPYQPGIAFNLEHFLKIYPEVPATGVMSPGMERYTMQVAPSGGSAGSCSTTHRQRAGTAAHLRAARTGTGVRLHRGDTGTRPGAGEAGGSSCETTTYGSLKPTSWVSSHSIEPKTTDTRTGVLIGVLSFILPPTGGGPANLGARGR